MKHIIKDPYIKGIAQILCIWAIIALLYFIIVKFVWN